MKKAIFIILPLFTVICAVAVIISKVSSTPPSFSGEITLTRTRGYMDLYNLSYKSFMGYSFRNSARFLHNSPYVFQDGSAVERYNISSGKAEQVYPQKKDENDMPLLINNIIPMNKEEFLFVCNHKLFKYDIEHNNEELLIDTSNLSYLCWIDKNYDYAAQTNTIYYSNDNGEISAYDMQDCKTNALGLFGGMPRVSGDGRFLVYRHGKINKKKLTVYDQATGSSWTRPAKDYIEDFCFSPDAEYVAVLEPDRSLTNFSVGNSRQISVWDYKNNKSYVVYKYIQYSDFRLDWIA